MSVFQIEDSQERNEGVCSLIDEIINENVGLVISRQLFGDICLMLVKVSTDEAKSLAQYALDKIQPRAISFEEQVTSYRQLLAEIYEREGDWKKAASMLSGIPLETSQK